MHALPASVPEGEFPRSEVVAVRLARRIAPLFGVAWAGNPYGQTWVCDFSALTLAEVARGAPFPARDGVSDSGSGRGVPADDESAGVSIASATLNRFGPHTKSAVVLTGANRLLAEITSAVTLVCRDLGAQKLHRSVQLAIWAGLVLEAFRAQPALIVAALQARAVQRSLTARWGEHVAGTHLLPAGARCEIGARAAGPTDPALAPTRFALIDDTLDALQPRDVTGAPIGLERRSDIASAWARRLLRMGSPGSGMVWVGEDDHGNRTANAYQRVGAMTAPFVAEVLDAEVASVEALPAWPADDVLAKLDPLAVRAYAVALHAAVSYVRYLETPAQRTPELRRTIPVLLHTATAAVTARLGDDDPAAVMLTGYADSADLEDVLRHADGRDRTALRGAVERQLMTMQRVSRAWRRGFLAPGTATYLLEIGCVALGAAAERAPAHLDDGLGRRVGRSLQRAWREALTARGLPDDPVAELPRLTPSQVFHLQNYAHYLARRDTLPDLRKALAVMEAVAQVRDDVAHTEPVGLIVKHTSARQSHELACAVAWRLCELTPPRERTAAARHAATAVRHLRAVLADPSTRAVLAGPANTRPAGWALDAVGPALLDLLRERPEVLSDDELAVAALLVRAADPTAPIVARLAEFLRP